MMLPAKVAISPKAMRTDSCISPCGASHVPMNRSMMPASDKTAAMSSCLILSFIFSNPLQKYNKKTEPPNFGAPLLSNYFFYSVMYCQKSFASVLLMYPRTHLLRKVCGTL